MILKKDKTFFGGLIDAEQYDWAMRDLFEQGIDISEYLTALIRMRQQDVEMGKSLAKLRADERIFKGLEDRS